MKGNGSPTTWQPAESCYNDITQILSPVLRALSSLEAHKHGEGPELKNWAQINV